MFKEKLKNMTNKKKIENLFFLIIILIVTLIIVNSILKNDESKNEITENITEERKVLAEDMQNTYTNTNLEKGLEEILSSIKGAGNVKVFLNYSESSKTVAMYDETTTTSSTEESDSSGGTRNITETESKKDVIYSEEDGNKTPITEKTVMPTIVGAIVTSEGAGNSNIKTNIINAVCSVTGLTLDKIQVFEMK